jgi:2-isopropylmalate synthase
MARITIFDTTLRDGERSPGFGMTASEKLRMAQELAELGVDVIEAGLAAASPEDAESIRRIGAEVSGPVIASLARATRTEIERAAYALEHADRPRIHVVLATSDAVLERRLGISREECIERADAAVRIALESVDDVEFTAEDATRADLDFLCRVVDSAVRAGARTINVPDSAGCALPEQIGRLFRGLHERVPTLGERVVSTHCHDDLGLAVANSLAAVGAGARQIQCTIAGIGERAGIAALEEVVMALRVRGDELGHETGVRTERLHRASRLLSYLTGIETPPHKAIVGRNAFTDDPGIRGSAGAAVQAFGVLTPEMVGAPGASRAAGKPTGPEGLEARYQALGYALTPEELVRVERDFTALADRKKVVLDEDLLSILHHGVMDDVEQVYRLSWLDVRCGSEVSEAAVVIGSVGDPPRTGRGEGDGPIAAVFAAMDSLLDFRVVLQDLTIRSATPGGDAIGEVSIHATIDGHSFTGRAAHTDVVRASADAFLHAVNKAAAARALEASHLAEISDVWGV